ncbi:hypothetical protein TNCV_4279751 [Trichonephila clavipes]|nr:hypothetical protein TNCV_4279751 [Trichonephila clavipes]
MVCDQVFVSSARLVASKKAETQSAGNDSVARQCVAAFCREIVDYIEAEEIETLPHPTYPPVLAPGDFFFCSTKLKI